MFFCKENMLNIKYAELHNGLILGGKNFKEKLDPHSVPELRLVLEIDKDRLIIVYKDEVSLMPLTNVKHKVLYKVDAKKVIDSLIEPQSLSSTEITRQANSHPMVLGIQSAQVETPFGHVHQGPGKGKTGASKK